MPRFNFEKNLDHQTRAVESIVAVFDGLDIERLVGFGSQHINPIINKEAGYRYISNIRSIQQKNGIEGTVKENSNIIDIMMETGTGKTYTYTKTIFELNRVYGIFKFVIIVPTLAIKAGAISFLTSESAIEHFKEQYGKVINLHVVESQKNNKNKKNTFPSAVIRFVEAGNFEKDQIQVMIINAGMINSDTMNKSYDKTLLDKYSNPFDAVASVRPFLIIDEPHRFAQENKTWRNIQKMNPQFTIRYGATFRETENLVYRLTAADAFNKNLIKGVIGHITEFENGKNAIVKFFDSDGKEASFELIENGIRRACKLAKKESLEKIHPAMTNLFIEKLNKSEVVLSNGLELKKGDKINPYSYAETLQEIMIKKAIRKHFELERQLLTREVKIKPLTLFFIDNIDEYRNENGYIRNTVEKYIKVEAEKLLKEETNEFYKEYLEKTLQNISQTHGGYFSKDNIEKDEEIEQEINEILHDKEAILDLNNPRRFIFSKWTLREGWDNPNVFQICKLRSSGSEISKLQEVGRGLRLPVNEYGNRVKDEQFYLNYFVDFTENDFVEKLINEINEKSGALSFEKVPEKLDENMIKKICEIYNIEEERLLEELDSNNVITRTNKFKEKGFEYIKRKFPLIFDGVSPSKVRKETEKNKKIQVRTEKYSHLKELWEKINQKVILEYKIENEKDFKDIFVEFLKEHAGNMIHGGVVNREVKVNMENNYATAGEEITIKESELVKISVMRYDEFLIHLSRALNANIKTLHEAFVEADIDINQYLNVSTIRTLKHKFDNYLLKNAIAKFAIEYHKVTSEVHPTKLTDREGNVRGEIDASDIGMLYSEDKVADNYLFEELFYDSELEKENIKSNVKEVVVFTKIPKNSIKIPVSGGKSYSPDFAYVLNFEDGRKKLYFIVETKNADSDSLRDEEIQKIKHAEKFFDDTVKIKFVTQYNNQKITDLINKIYNEGI
ncbi:type III restriction-modification system endonuclease [Geobacillus stearothermophilus]|uniref:type III restriction-modification system endonuclease n=1 Tax=Geobacillus stearothermophilus TaxID=1422 RepID=UPI002E22662A|nr:type III restriction-modification system endonuclease [Geobacillus stearothermophilus]MED4356522.1 type III restriction-modification system endonuclease [Geobacillus stearothermophilus]MED4830751.1 type III restriction-modification system endonuclease [Geobacillus stearothermophilus]MED5014355.1 type III restriction-modification system endonuclease [Geobacillus stearothermophilus]MED5043749.1 type III restriction-modification system endonuclease [Geobacillus stearothermophilus]